MPEERSHIFVKKVTMSGWISALFFCMSCVIPPVFSPKRSPRPFLSSFSFKKITPIGEALICGAVQANFSAPNLALYRYMHTKSQFPPFAIYLSMGRCGCEDCNLAVMARDNWHSKSAWHKYEMRNEMSVNISAIAPFPKPTSLLRLHSCIFDMLNYGIGKQ